MIRIECREVLPIVAYLHSWRDRDPRGTSRDDGFEEGTFADAVWTGYEEVLVFS